MQEIIGPKVAKEECAVSTERIQVLTMYLLTMVHLNISSVEEDGCTAGALRKMPHGSGQHIDSPLNAKREAGLIRDALQHEKAINI